MVCPNCKTRFDATQSMCPDCFADLVEGPNDEPSAPPTRREPERPALFSGRSAEPAPTAREKAAVPVERARAVAPAERDQAVSPPGREQAVAPPPREGRLTPPSPVRPAGRIRYDEPSPAGNVFTWGVAAALLVGLGLGGWHLTHRSPGPAPAAQAPGADLPSAQRSLSEARRYLALGSYGDAAREARLALTLLGPRAGSMATRPAREVLAQALLKSQDYERAAAEYQMLASYFPEDTSYSEGLKQAKTALSVGQRAEADESLRQARQLFASGRYREAADQADSAALSYAALPGGSHQRIECRRLAAQAYAHQGEYRSALYAWNEVLQARPHDPTAQAGLAEAERQLQASTPPRPVARALPVRVRRPSSRPVAVSVAPAPVAQQPAYPTAARKKDEFYPSETPGATEEGPRSERRPPRGPVPPEDDPYAEQGPPPGAGGPGGPEELPPPLPPQQVPPAAAVRPQLPRLPSLTYPAGGPGNGIPGYASGQRPGPASAGTQQGGLPGYYSEKGRQNNGGGIPGL